MLETGSVEYVVSTFLYPHFRFCYAHHTVGVRFHCSNASAVEHNSGRFSVFILSYRVNHEDAERLVWRGNDVTSAAFQHGYFGIQKCVFGCLLAMLIFNSETVYPCHAIIIPAHALVHS